MPAGTITALQVQERDKERVNIFIDGSFAIGISIRTLQASGLYKGRRITEEEYAALEEQEQADKAYNAALSLLSARPRSEHELRDKLRRKDFPDDHIDAAINRLRELKLLDDAAYARLWVENRQTHRPRGAQALRQELRKKGIDKQTIAETLEEAIDPEGEQERALEVGRAALRKYGGTDKQTFKRRMGAYLQRRGFGFGVLKTTLDTLWAEVGGEEEPSP